MSLLIVRLFYISYTQKFRFSTKKKGNIILNALMCKRFNKSARNRVVTQSSIFQLLVWLPGIWDETFRALEHASHGLLTRWRTAPLDSDIS